MSRQAIAALRRLRFTGPEIAEILDRPLSTVSGILARIGMGRLGRLGLEPAERYERQVAGELIHVDVKKLGRIRGGAGKRITGIKRNPYKTHVDKDGVRRKVIGWEYVHIAIDDALAWRTPRFSATRRPSPRSASCAARSRSLRAMA